MMMDADDSYDETSSGGQSIGPLGGDSAHGFSRRAGKDGLGAARSRRAQALAEKDREILRLNAVLAQANDEIARLTSHRQRSAGLIEDLKEKITASCDTTLRQLLQPGADAPRLCAREPSRRRDLTHSIESLRIAVDVHSPTALPPAAKSRYEDPNSTLRSLQDPLNASVDRASAFTPASKSKPKHQDPLRADQPLLPSQRSKPAVDPLDASLGTTVTTHHSSSDGPTTPSSARVPLPPAATPAGHLEGQPQREKDDRRAHDRKDIVQNVFDVAVFSLKTQESFRGRVAENDIVCDPLLKETLDRLKDPSAPAVGAPAKLASTRQAAWFKPVFRFMAQKRKKAIAPLATIGIKTYVPVSLAAGPEGAERFEAGSLSVMSVPLGLPPPTETGNWEPVLADGRLFKLTRPSPCGGRSLLFYNGTRDPHFNVEYSFTQRVSLAVGPTVSVDGDCYSVAVASGDTVEFATGYINGYRMTIKFGPPSQEYLNGLQKRFDAQISEQLAAIRQLTLRDGVDLNDDAAVVDACYREGIQYIDWKFAPRASALARSWEGEFASYPWMRPKDYLTSEAADEAHLFSGLTSDGNDPIQPNDIDQGKLGDCWLLCAISAMAEQPNLVRKIFHVPEASKEARSVGAFTLRVCKHGWWQKVTVDNYFPCNGRGLVFGSNVQEAGELWVALLEKVVAKVHGSYKAITRGDSIESLQDLSGFPAERFKWDDPGLFERVLMFDDPAIGNGEYMMTIETPGVDKSERIGGNGQKDDLYESLGLVAGHAYALLTAAHIHPKNGPEDGFKLCCIRNPWGDAKEWTGKWSDNDAMWERYPDAAEECDFKKGNDGTFWMEWDDVMKWFCGGGVCFVSPTWHDLRLASAVRGGKAVHMLEVYPHEDASCFIGVHQRDRRGLKEDDKDKAYGAFLISVIEPTANNGWSVPATGYSHAGSFWRGRDCHLCFDFKRDTVDNRPYYVVWQSHASDLTKQVVISMLSSSKFATINVKHPDLAVLNAVKFNPIWKFSPAQCKPARAWVQLNQQERTLSTINMRDMPDPLEVPLDV